MFDNFMNAMTSSAKLTILILIIALLIGIMELTVRYSNKQSNEKTEKNDDGEKQLPMPILENLDSGIKGEINIVQKLETLPGTKRIIWNARIPTTNRRGTQIDAIMLHETGIFVIESKNMKGWIFGKEDDATWTQKFPKSSYRFQNPIQQNAYHCKELSQYLHMDIKNIYNVIIFDGTATLKNVPDGEGYLLTVDYDILPRLIDKIGKLEPKFSKSDIEKIALKLKN